MLRSACGRGFTFEKFWKDEINIDVFVMIDEGAHNHHLKEVIALGYDTN
jgi:hypothetical protein